MANLCQETFSIVFLPPVGWRDKNWTPFPSCQSEKVLFFNRIGCGLFGRSTLWLGSGNRASTPVLWRSVAPAHASFSKDLGSLQLEILDNFLPFKDFENIECSASTYVLWQLICGMPPSLKGISFCANVCIYSVQKVWNDISSFKFFIEFCRQLSTSGLRKTCHISC